MNRAFVSVAIFVLGLLTLTKLDQTVNAVLYGYGLQFSSGWYTQYEIVYVLLFQGLVVLCALYARSIRGFLLGEAFVLSSTQDLIFFAVWQGGAFPSGQWTWRLEYSLFGSWTTGSQLLLSMLSLLSAFAMTRYATRMWKK